MGWQNSPATITVTQSGELVRFKPDYDRKVVRVYVDGVDLGEYRNRTAAKEALGLSEVLATGRK
jgi:hypothetical protein